MSGKKPPRTTSAMSLHLSRVLDAVGVSERTVNKRRQTILKLETILNINMKLNDNDRTFYLYGSQSEGSTTFGLASEIDGLIQNETAIQSVRERIDGMVNVLILQGEDIPAGYCRLQYMLPIPTILPENESFTYNDEGRVILKHWFINFPECTFNGPAATKTWHNGSVDQDFVYALKCDSVSKQVKPLIKRSQTKHWPTSDMLRTALESGFFLVPVGHRLSTTRDVEWRVSPSLTERCLMFGMNTTQMKCYVILKMIKKDMIIPKIGESITSFHLKNVLFHCVENTPKKLWSAVNLVACIDECLKYLLSCVQKRSCPNFLIPGENLLSGRITKDKINPLNKLLHDLIQSNGLYLFEITCDHVGDLLNQCINLPSTTEPDIFVLGEGAVLGWCKKLKKGSFQSIVEYVLKHASVEQVKKRLVKLRTIQNSSKFHIKSVATTYLQLLYSTYSSMLASMCIRKEVRISRCALSYLEHGCGYDLMSGRLKKASALYCCGQYTESASVLEDLDSRYDFRCVHPVCDCLSNHNREMKQEFKRRFFFDSSKNDNTMLTACHVTFTTREIHCCPLALRFDMFRGIGEDQGALETWMDMAAVDSVIFLYFLMYLTYGSMGNRQLQHKALLNLTRSLGTNEEQEYIKHPETAFNLLGQCFEMEGMSERALKCYKLSLQYRRNNNSALWHVTLLIYKHFWRYCFINKHLSLT